MSVEAQAWQSRKEAALLTGWGDIWDRLGCPPRPAFYVALAASLATYNLRIMLADGTVVR